MLERGFLNSYLSRVTPATWLAMLGLRVLLSNVGVAGALTS